jgi:hypothetical protein
MAKVTVASIVSGYLAAGDLNAALLTLATAFDNTVSRDGTTPNAMEADLDLNGHVLLNSGISDNPSALVSLEAMQDYVDSRASDLLIQRTQTFTATASQTDFVLTEFTYTPASGNIAVYVDGVRKFQPTDYTEESSTLIKFVVGLTVGQKVVVVQTDFIATVELPTHQHSWGQITGTPVFTTRWPTWSEVTDKPTTFTPAAHNQDANTITTGRLADARRGVFVQASAPTGLGAGDAGVLWFW